MRGFGFAVAGVLSRVRHLLSALSPCLLFLVLPCVARADFMYADFSSISGLQLNGIGAGVDNVLQITGGPPTGAAGSAWFATKQFIADGFSTTFQFRITNPSGIEDDSGEPGGDGFAFVSQNTSLNALGNGGAGIGYDPIPNSVAVEFDMFHNGPKTFNLGDTNGNHINIHTLGTAPNSASEPPFSTASIGNSGLLPVDMSDGAIHTVRISYVPPIVSVFLDDLVTPRLTVSLAEAPLPSLEDGLSWVGFTSGIAAASQNHDILNWSFSEIPEPSTVALLAMAALGLLFYRGK